MKSDTNTVFFSIIVPVFKTEKYLHTCVDSLINQTFQDIEIILVNDGSPDLSPQICDEYAKKFANIRVIHKNNRGLSDARNCGLQNATGKYVLFVDSDDYIATDACQVFYNSLNQAKDIDILLADNYRLKNGKLVKDGSFINCDVQTGQEYYKRQLINRTLFKMVVRNIYSRDFLVKNNLFFKEGILHEDDLWTPQVLFSANRVMQIDYAFYYYIIRFDSITGHKTHRHYEDSMYICEELGSLSNKIQDSKLKYLFQDNLFSTYVHAFIKTSELGVSKKVNPLFLKSNARSWKNKCRAYIIMCNVNFYRKYVYKRKLSINE